MEQKNCIERAAYIMEQFKEGFLETAGNRIVFSGLVITRLDLAQGDSGQLTASCRFFVFFSMAAGATAAAAVVAPPRWACCHREYDQYWCGPCRSWTDFRYDHTHFGGTHPPACFLLLLPDSPFDGTKFYPVTCVGPFLVGAQCVCVCVCAKWMETYGKLHLGKCIKQHPCRSVPFELPPGPLREIQGVAHKWDWRMCPYVHLLVTETAHREVVEI